MSLAEGTLPRVHVPSALRFEKHVQRLLAAKTGLFHQPSFTVLHTGRKGMSAREYRAHLIKTALSALSSTRTKFLKPTDSSMGDKIVRIFEKDGRHIFETPGEEIPWINKIMASAVGQKPSKSQREELLQHWVGHAALFHTGLQKGSDLDLLTRILSTSKRWMLEDEIPGAALDGRPLEIRCICLWDARTGLTSCRAHYAKVGQGFVSNRAKGGSAMTTDQAVQTLTGWSTAARQRFINELTSRAATLTQAYAEFTRSPYAASMAIDIIPELKHGRPRLWFVELNEWAYHTQGLRQLDAPFQEAIFKERKELEANFRELNLIDFHLPEQATQC